MTIDRIPSSAPSLLAAAGGAGNSAAGLVRAGAGAIAVQVLGPVTAEFLGHGTQAAASATSLRELSAALAETLGAGPIETVDLERAVESLAGALAADLAAFADGRTLDRLEAAMAAAEAGPAADGAPTAGRVAQAIEDIAGRVMAAR